MEKSVIPISALIFCSVILATASSSSSSSPSQNPKSVQKWIETLIHKQEKTTKLHFYFHRLGGPNPTGVTVAQANMTNRPPNGFGLTVMRDDPLTLGPDLSSARIGYAQGMSATTALEDEVSLTDYFTFYFTATNSTLAVLGRNPIFETYREMPVVGGTGVFRLARGVVTLQTYFFNTTSREATIEADVVVFHF